VDAGTSDGDARGRVNREDDESMREMGISFDEM
jgi:hypothetical protein